MNTDELAQDSAFRRRAGVWIKSACLVLSTLPITCCGVRDPWARLQELSDAKRYVAPRLSSGSAHRRCGSWDGARCADRPSPGSHQALTWRGLTTPPAGTGQGEHARGLIVLMTGDPSGRAISHLERAAWIQSGDSYRVYSDLAAARLVRGSEAAAPEHYISALDAAEQALEQRPGYLPALYNRAAALQELFLPTLARDAWQAYLRLEADEGWRGEVLEHLQALDADPVAGLSPEFDREVFLREGLGALTTSSCPSGALDQSIARLMAIGEHWRVETNDSFFLDVARWAKESLCAAETAPRVRAALAAFTAAMASYDRRDSVAASLLGDAVAQLDRLSSPLRWAASVYESFGVRRLGDDQYARQAHSMALLNSARLEAADYLWLSARSHWSSGTALYRLADLAGSNGEYRQTLDRLTQARDLRNASLVASLLAEGLLEAGRSSEAWSRAYDALRMASLAADDYHRYIVLEQLSLMTMTAGFERAGVVLQAEALLAARSTENPYLVSDALRVDAVLLARVGKPDEALRQLDEARSEAMTVSDELIRERALAAIDLANGNLEGAVQPSERVAALTSAMERYSGRLAHAPYAALARVLRARSYREAGDLVSAERDLNEAIRFVERYGAGLADPSQRVAIFDQFEIYDQLLELLVDSFDQSEQALLVAERERLATYRRGTSQLLPREADLDRLVLGLGSREGVLVIRQVDQRWLAWCLSSEGVRLGLDVPAADLNWALQVLEQPPVAGVDPLWRAASEAIYNRIFRGLAWFLDDLETLTVIPGRHLSNLPFAGLRDAETSRYLGEHLLIRAAPSLFLAAAHSGKPARVNATGYVVVADPDPAAEFRQLGRLPAAQQEARIVERWLGEQGQVLVGPEATEGQFLEHLRSARITHFAGHAVVDPYQPWRSSLILSPDERDDGLLTAEEILGRPIGSSLVVLSACDSAMTLANGGSAAGFGLTLPFLVAGVPEVIGVLAPLEDSVGMQFFELFYQELARTESVPSAFHEAQMLALDRQNLGPKAFYFALNSLIDIPQENI